MSSMNHTCDIVLSAHGGICRALLGGDYSPDFTGWAT